MMKSEISNRSQTPLIQLPSNFGFAPEEVNEVPDDASESKKPMTSRVESNHVEVEKRIVEPLIVEFVPISPVKRRPIHKAADEPEHHENVLMQKKRRAQQQRKLEIVKLKVTEARKAEKARQISHREHQ